MSKLKIVKGDLIALAKEGRFTHIAHGCNCYCVMGAGIALAIAQEFPIAEKTDKLTSRGDFCKLGNLTQTEFHMSPKSSVVIVNLYTQFQPGADFVASALDLSLFKLIRLCGDRIKLGVPWIGCGIGGGDKKEVKKIFEKYAKKIDITVVEYALTKPIPKGVGVLKQHKMDK